jgi:hypothetical protein
MRSSALLLVVSAIGCGSNRDGSPAKPTVNWLIPRIER